MAEAQIGLIGLAVMGENLALNIENKGFPIAVYNRTTSKTEAFLNGRAKGKSVIGAKTIEEFVRALQSPRRILLMVKAGDAVDTMIQHLVPHLQLGDILIDGGNSYFKDTERRQENLTQTGVLFFGMGVSGGEEGALHGPSLMPGGGSRGGYNELEPILTKIAAQVDDGPCVTYVGPRGAGHFVKMVHNGIEYGDMQLIAEAYDLLKNGAGLTADELHTVFDEWNQGELQSFLIEITARIVNFPDSETASPLVEMILDKAGQKGTGKWTSQVAMDLGVPIPTISSAVDARFMSAMKGERVTASAILRGARETNAGRLSTDFIDKIRDALYASKICSYAQGFALMRAASREFDYVLNLSECARIWKGGCIIRARFLDHIKEAFKRNSDLASLLIDEEFASEIRSREDAWRRTVAMASDLCIPVPAMTASLSYFDAYRRERLPANLIQAQRDFFGAHTYERIDHEGKLHTEWTS